MCSVPERAPPSSALSPSVEGAIANLLLDAAAIEVTSAFERAGVSSRLLKGAAIASWLYDPGEERTYLDVDLLVAPDHVSRAEEVLVQLGFALVAGGARGDRPRHARVWERARDGTVVDLHTSLVGLGVSAEEAWDALANPSEETSISGKGVPAFAAPARTLHVVLHAAQHGDRSPRALVDLERAILRVPPDVWEQAEALARRLQALPSFIAGLRLVPEGERLAGRLALERASSVEADLRARIRHEDTLGFALGFEWLARVGSTRARLAFLRLKLAPPPAEMRRRYPLASRGVIGLGSAYLLRLVRLAPHAVPAYAEWRKARKRGGDSNP
jgi:Uncharacterised nucleotidyltransferase